MVALILILLLLGPCAPTDEEHFFCEVDGDCAGPADAVGVGGGGGSAGEGGARETSTSSGTSGEGGAAAGGGEAGAGGEGGSGGSPCEPSTADCGEATCGDAPDGCGGKVTCGGCDAGDRCIDGACCKPATCEPGMCGRHEDGCGGVVVCDSVCGDGSGWMTCGETGWCECTSAEEIPRGEFAEADCQVAGLGHAFSCGEPYDHDGKPYSDVPDGCQHRFGRIGVNGPIAWCCE